METILRSIKRPIVINGVSVTDLEELLRSINEGDEISVNLYATSTDAPTKEETSPEKKSVIEVGHTYILKVRQYMTLPSSDDFTFQQQWNNNVPMPFRIMKGKIIKETRGTVYAECHAVPLKTNVCIRCGRTLTNPVSRLYGIGPECGGHASINPFNTEEELYAALDQVSAKLASITWEGWIIKSAIEQFQETA